MTRESILKKIEDEIDAYYDDPDLNRDDLQIHLLCLFIELVEELVDLLNIEEQNIIYSKPTSDLPKGRARDEFEARMKLRSELRQKLAELGGK